MKLGVEDKKKTLIAAGLLILAVALLLRAFHGSGETQSTSSTPVATLPSAPAATAERKAATHKARPMGSKTLDPTLRLDLLKSSEDVTYKGNGRDIFRSQPEMAAIPKAEQPDVKPSGPPPPPPPPPINLKFYGFASRKDGNKRIFLSQGEDIFVAREGDIVDRRYKIVHINPTSVEVEDVLTNNRQTLPLSAG